MIKDKKLYNTGHLSKTGDVPCYVNVNQNRESPEMTTHAQKRPFVQILLTHGVSFVIIMIEKLRKKIKKFGGMF